MAGSAVFMEYEVDVKTMQQIERYNKLKYIFFAAGFVLGVKAPFWLEMLLLVAIVYYTDKRSRTINDFPASHINLAQTFHFLLGMAIGDVGSVLYNLFR